MKKILFLWSLFLSTATRSQSWIPLVNNLNAPVNCMAKYNNKLYLGGHFTSSGGNPANYIVQWDGVNFQAVGSQNFNDAVLTLCEYNGELYAGGRFTMIGTLPVNHIAKWNGVSWSAVDLGADDDIQTLCVFNSQLIAGGTFSSIGGISANKIAAWNGVNWISIGNITMTAPFQAVVSALIVFNSELYVGGLFNSINGNSINSLAKWNGVSWSTFGSGTNGPILTFAVLKNNLYAGGHFSFVDPGINAINIAKYDGINWSSIGNTNFDVLSLTSSSSNLYAGGNFTVMGGVSVEHVAYWNGTSWSGISYGLDNEVRTVYIFNSTLFAGGNFHFSGSQQINYIAQAAGLALPVKLISFSGLVKDNKIKLSWNVENNDEIGDFIVERSVDGINFVSIGHIPNNQNNKKYEFTDPSPAKKNFYRLKLPNNTYSRFIRIDIKSKSEPLFSQMDNIVTISNLNEPYKLKVFGIDGKLIKQEMGVGTKTLTLPQKIVILEIFTTKEHYLKKLMY